MLLWKQATCFPLFLSHANCDRMINSFILYICTVFCMSIQVHFDTPNSGQLFLLAEPIYLKDLTGKALIPIHCKKVIQVIMCQ